MEDMKCYVDFDDALARVRGNKRVYKTLLSVFLKDDHVPTLADQIQSGDQESAARTAHTLKGVAANLSLTALYNAALSIEMTLKNRQAADDGLIELEKARVNTRRCVEHLINNL